MANLFVESAVFFNDEMVLHLESDKPELLIPLKQTELVMHFKRLAEQASDIDPSVMVGEYRLIGFVEKQDLDPLKLDVLQGVLYSLPAAPLAFLKTQALRKALHD